MTKAIIFDVDGTLLNTERIYMQAWKEAGKLAGYDVPDDVLLRTRAIHRAEAIRLFQEALGPEFDYQAIYLIRTGISERLIEQATDLLLPGVSQTLEQLHHRGCLMAVASSTNQEKTISHLEHAGLLHYFQAVVGGDMVERGKPDPDIFLLAASLLGQAPGSCVVVGDTPADVKAAAAAGIPAVLIPDCVQPGPEIRSMCNTVLDSMHQLIPWLEE